MGDDDTPALFPRLVLWQAQASVVPATVDRHVFGGPRLVNEVDDLAARPVLQQRTNDVLPLADHKWLLPRHIIIVGPLRQGESNILHGTKECRARPRIGDLSTATRLPPTPPASPMPRPALAAGEARTPVIGPAPSSARAPARDASASIAKFSPLGSHPPAPLPAAPS